MRLGFVGLVMGVVLGISSSAFAQRANPGLRNVAQQSARAGNGRFLLLRPTQRVLRQPVTARGTFHNGGHVGSSTVDLHYRPASAVRAGSMTARVPEFYRGSTVQAHQTQRLLSVTDVAGGDHHLVATVHVAQGSRMGSYSRADISVAISRGVTVSQEDLRAALIHSNMMSPSAELTAAH